MPESARPQPENVFPAARDSIPPPPGPVTLPPERPLRRWKRRLVISLLVILAILAVLVGFAPTIASTPVAYNAILAVANGKLQGTLRVDGVSLSWGGPIETPRSSRSCTSSG